MTLDRRAKSAPLLTEAEQNRLIVENMKLAPAVAASYRGGSIQVLDLGVDQDRIGDRDRPAQGRIRLVPQGRRSSAPAARELQQ